MTRVERFERLRGTLTVPGDKSISHRALILGAMGRGASVHNLSTGEDVASTIRCLRKLGHEVERGGDSHRVQGGWAPTSTDLDAGNSGTTMRLLMGALAGARGTWTLSGDRSLNRRPMQRVADPLRLMGASIQTVDGHPPVTVTGAKLRGITYAAPVASAQLKSCLLLAGLQADGPTVVHEPVATRDHTERILSWLGADVSIEGAEVRLEGSYELPSFELQVPGDYSSAAFVVAAAVLLAGSEVTVEQVGLNPTRRGFERVLSKMKADVWGEVDRADPEPVGRLTARGASQLSATEVTPDLAAECIDELPLVAVLATQAEGATTVTGAGELRVKESDRIESLATGLRELGANVETHPDGITVYGPTPLQGGVVDAAGDHRLAMAFAVAAQVASGDVVVNGFESATISYPTFPQDLRSLAS